MSKLLESLNTLRLKGSYCDVLVRGKDNTDQPAHRIVLAAASPVFDRELSAHNNMKQPSVILLKGIDSELIGRLLDLIYTKDSFKNVSCKKLANLCKLLEIDVELSAEELDCTEDENASKAFVANTNFHKRKRLKCHFCQMVFFTQTQLFSHLKSHSKDSTTPPPPTEKLVSAISEKETNVDVMLLKSKLLGDGMHHCFLCKHKYSTAGNLKRHYLTVHEKIKPFSCVFCNKSYGQKVTLQIHVKTTHMSEDCKANTHNDSSDQCNNDQAMTKINSDDITNLAYDSDMTDSMSQDKRLMGDNVRYKSGFEVLKGSRLNLNSTCHICHKKLSRPSNLKKHLLIHYSKDSSTTAHSPTNTAAHTSAHTASTTNTANSFASEGDVVNDALENTQAGPEAHNISFNVVSTDSSLADSTAPTTSLVEASHSNKPLHKRFVCEVCGKSFSLGEYLRKHFLSVHDTSKHTCPVCRRSFSTGALLQRHKRVHERRWCDKCKKVFEGRRALSSHLRTSTCAHQTFVPQEHLGLL